MVLVGGVIIWLLSYVLRVLTHDMTYHQQIKDYEEQMIENRWASMSPEEQEKLQSEIAAEKAANQS